jgi:hypothetical protein
MLHSRACLVALLVVMLIGKLSTYCAHAEVGPPELQSALRTPGARNIVQREVADQWHLSYEVELSYPQEAIGQNNKHQLEEMGWVPCARPGDDWSSFEDASGQNPQVVHQHLSHWVRKDRLLVILLRYFSSFSENALAKGPTNDTQHVYVILAPFNQQVEDFLDISCP